MARKKDGETRTAQRKIESEKKERAYSCQICGKKFNDPVDTMAHLIDHGSSALDSMSQMIKNQKEGRVNGRSDKPVESEPDELEPF